MQLNVLIKTLLEEQGLTAYGAAQLLGAETDENVKMLHEWLRRLLRRSPQFWSRLTSLLRVLGYEIRIVRRRSAGNEVGPE